MTSATTPPPPPIPGQFRRQTLVPFERPEAAVTLTPSAGQFAPSRGQVQPHFPAGFHLPLPQPASAPPSPEGQRRGAPTARAPRSLRPPLPSGSVSSCRAGPRASCSHPLPPWRGCPPSPERREVPVTPRGAPSGEGGGSRGGGGGGPLTSLPAARPEAGGDRSVRPRVPSPKSHLPAARRRRVKSPKARRGTAGLSPFVRRRADRGGGAGAAGLGLPGAEGSAAEDTLRRGPGPGGPTLGGAPAPRGSPAALRAPASRVSRAGASAGGASLTPDPRRDPGASRRRLAAERHAGTSLPAGTTLPADAPRLGRTTSRSAFGALRSTPFPRGPSRAGLRWALRPHPRLLLFLSFYPPLSPAKGHT